MMMFSRSKMEIPVRMIEHLKQMAKAVPLETAFHWELPANPPIEIPASIAGSFSQNVYLKENLAPVLEKDSHLTAHYWVIRDWGGIRTFKKCDRNDARIGTFKAEILKGKLTRDSFGCISSLSKLSSFWEPARYAIYDSRAVFSLNWIIFRYSNDRQLFPQPPGRNADVSKYNIDTLFALSGINHRYRPYTTAYHEYCGLLEDLSKQIYVSRKPYFAEMLLFLAAPTIITEDIERSVTVTVAVKNGTPAGQKDSSAPKSYPDED
jgi:hypothetical protein